MGKWPQSVGTALVLLALGHSATAADLVVFGPAGSETERTAFVAVERDDGTCADPGSLRFHAEEPGTTVTIGESVSPCVSRIVLRSPTAVTEVHIRATGPGTDLSARVAMSAGRIEAPVASRTAGRLRVVSRATGSATPTLVVAVWNGGRAALTETEPGVFSGAVPPGRLLLVIATRGTAASAAVVPAVGLHGSEVLLATPGLALPQGGTSRTAAFIAITDGSGRLSQNVPLEVQSDRGVLRRLTWLAPGLAVVELGGREGVETADLLVRGANRAANLSESRTEIRVEPSWPVRARIEAPNTTTRGAAVPIRVSAQRLDGHPVDVTMLRVRCGARDVTLDADGRAECTFGSDPGDARTIAARVLTNGRTVTLATRSVTVLGPVPSTQPADSTASSHPPSASPTPLPVPDRRRAQIALAVMVWGAADLWLRGTVGGGLRAEAHLSPALRLSLAARYGATALGGDASAPVEQNLRGVQHTVDLQFGAGLERQLGPVRGVIRLSAGPGIAYSAASVGARAAVGRSLLLVGQLAVGVRRPVGPVDLGIEVGGRAQTPLAGNAWADPPLGFFVEVSGALRALH